MRKATAIFVGLVLLPSAVTIADTVFVKYRGPVDTSNLSCEWVTRSSLVKRLCYDAKNRYVIVSLNGIYYHYCGMPSDVVRAWQVAESMGRFFNEYVKGRFDCRVNPVPEY